MPSLVNLLKDVDVQAISLVPNGANGQRIFLYKTDAQGITDLPPARILKAEDWSAFYIVVAEPGREEKPGLYGDQTTTDVWADEDEIRKAAWRFMKNGAVVNKMHEDMRPYGTVVENAVAHQDFQVGGETIRKGSWYVAIEPTAEGKQAVEDGRFSGVSIQGFGMRVAKDAALVPDNPAKQNWIDRTGTGALPKYIGDIAGDIMTEKGQPLSRAIQLAVGIVQRWCRGEGNVTAATRAKACAALAEWEAKRAQAHAMAKTMTIFPAALIKDQFPEPVEPDAETWSWANSGILESVPVEKESILRRVAKAVGIEVEEPPCDCGCTDFEAVVDLDETDGLIEKAMLTTAGRKALPKSAFVFPAKAPGPGSYPIHDRVHAINALARSKGKPEAGAVKSAVCARFKDLPACSGKVAKGLQEEPGTVEATDEENTVELSERVEQIEKTQKEQGEKLETLTKSVEPISGKLDEIAKAIEERKPEDEKPATPEQLSEKIEQIAEGQGILANSILGVNEQIEKMLDQGGSRQVDEDAGREKVAKSSHPLAGLLS